MNVTLFMLILSGLLAVLNFVPDRWVKLLVIQGEDQLFRSFFPGRTAALFLDPLDYSAARLLISCGHILLCGTALASATFFGVVVSSFFSDAPVYLEKAFLPWIGLAAQWLGVTYVFTGFLSSAKYLLLDEWKRTVFLRNNAWWELQMERSRKWLIFVLVANVSISSTLAAFWVH